MDITKREINQLYSLYYKTIVDIEIHTDIIFDFRMCNFFSNHACVFLGGLDLFLKKAKNINNIHYNINNNSIVFEYLDKIGFFKKDRSWSNLPYSDFSMIDIAEKKPYRDINYLLSSNIFPFKSDKAINIIKESIGELFLNVYQHSNSPSGATASAQYYPAQNVIQFSLIDFGYGIANHVSTFLNKKYNYQLSSKEALLRAFEAGFTTKEKASGTGLTNIKDLICMNESKISIFCNNLFYQFDGQTNSEIGFSLKEGSLEFGGTFVIIEFNTKKICYNL